MVTSDPVVVSRTRRALAIVVSGALLGLCAPSVAGQTQRTPGADRGRQAPNWPGQAFEPYRKKIAVVVGVDRYEKPIPSLRYAVEDARAFGHLLETQFGFDVRLLLNDAAKREGLINAIVRLVDETNWNDQLLFFFAGHGVSFGSDLQELGYLLPSDAAGLDRAAAWTSGIPMDELVTHIMKLPPKHILIVLDACFSGYAAVTPRGHPSGNPEQILRSLTSRSARQLLTAGTRGQQVFETEEGKHSFFVLELLEGLGKGRADQNRDGLIEISELYSYLKPAVNYRSDDRQTPYLATLDRGQGEFVFITKPRPRPALTKEGVRRKALIAHPGVPLFPSAYSNSSREAPYLATYFLFNGEENQRVPVSHEAGATLPDGWLEKGSFIEWNILEIALLMPLENGQLAVPLFGSSECALRFVAGNESESCLPMSLTPVPPGDLSRAVAMVPLLERQGEVYRGQLLPLQPAGQDRHLFIEITSGSTEERKPQGWQQEPSMIWVPRMKGKVPLLREAVFMRRRNAEVLVNMTALIGSAASEGAIEGADYFQRMVKVAFDGIGQALDEVERIDTLLAKLSVLPFRTTALAFTLQEVRLWKSEDFRQLKERLERKIVPLRDYVQDPRNSYNLGGTTQVFIPRDLFP
jgi:hypothetical protein